MKRTTTKPKRAPIEAWMTISCTREPYTLHRDRDEAIRERRHSVVHLTEARPDLRGEVRMLRLALRNLYKRSCDLRDGSRPISDYRGMLEMALKRRKKRKGEKS